MVEVLRGLQFCFTDIDDILIGSPDGHKVLQLSSVSVMPAFFGSPRGSSSSRSVVVGGGGVEYVHAGSVPYQFTVSLEREHGDTF